MNFKECRTCGELLEVNTDNYYLTQNAKGGYRFASPDCRTCYLQKERIERRQRRESKQHGSDAIYSKPNSYVDNIQKEQTFAFLTLLGWKFNEEKGIWYDDIKKTKDGEFIGVWKPKPVRHRIIKRLTEETFVPFEFQHSPQSRNAEKDELIKEMVKDYYVSDLSLREILNKYNVQESYLKYYIKQYKKQQLNNGIEVKRKNSKVGRDRKSYTTNRQPILELPRIKLTHTRLIEQYSQEFIKQIQTDYFINTMKYREVLEKYEPNQQFAKYVIHKSMLLLKARRK